MGDRDDYILFSGGAPGAEMAFGENAERLGIEEVNFAFEGHVHVRTPRPAHPQPRRAEGRRRQPRLRLEADEPPLHGRADDPQGAAVDLVSGQPRPGDLRDRRGAAGSHRQGRHRLGRRVRQAVQQAAVRLRSGPRSLVRLEGRRLGRPAPPASPSSATRTSPAPARGTSPTTARRRSPRCSTAASER